MDLVLGSSMGAQSSIVSNRISLERLPRLLHRFNFPCGTIENPDENADNEGDQCV